MRWCVAAWLHSSGNPIVDVPPVVGINIGGCDVQSFNRINDLKDAFDFRPALGCQQNVATGAHKGQRLEGFSPVDGAHDIDARKDGTMVIRRPADEGEGSVWFERDRAPATVEDLLLYCLAKANPVFNFRLDPSQLHVGEMVVALRAFCVVLCASHDTHPLAAPWLPAGQHASDKKE
jgi:hypothetical protein